MMFDEWKIGDELIFSQKFTEIIENRNSSGLSLANMTYTKDTTATFERIDNDNVYMHFDEYPVSLLKKYKKEHFFQGNVPFVVYYDNDVQKFEITNIKLKKLSYEKEFQL